MKISSTPGGQHGLNAFEIGLAVSEMFEVKCWQEMVVISQILKTDNEDIVLRAKMK